MTDGGKRFHFTARVSWVGGREGMLQAPGLPTIAVSAPPEFRGRGIHRALLAHRLWHAAEEGCDLALCECLPGSQSQRNQERVGFRVLYTKLVLKRPRPEPLGGGGE